MATIEINTNSRALGAILYYAFMEIYVQKRPQDIVPYEDLTQTERDNWTAFAKAVLRKVMI